MCPTAETVSVDSQAKCCHLVITVKKGMFIGTSSFSLMLLLMYASVAFPLEKYTI